MDNYKEIVCGYRKGIAIRRDKYRTHGYLKYDYKLIKGNDVIYGVAHLDNSSIHRSIDGRYFVTAMESYGACTYPGSDRDTEYYWRPIIASVLDENGICIIKHETKPLDTEIMNIYLYLETDPLKYAIDLGDGLSLYADTTFDINTNSCHKFNPLEYLLKIKKEVQPRSDKYSHEGKQYDYLQFHPNENTIKDENGEILCGSSIYDVNSTNCLFNLPCKIEPLEKFHEGKCKVGIVSDYRDFIAIVSKKNIISVYDVAKLGILYQLIKSDHKTFKINKGIESIQGVASLPEGEISFKTIKIVAEVVIEKYLLRFPSRYEMCSGITMATNSTYGIDYLYAEHNTTTYFNTNEGWIKIEGTNGRQIDKQIQETNSKRPNYIKKIEQIREDILINDETYSIYKFECRPYGYLTKDGRLEYAFDVNNIQW